MACIKLQELLSGNMLVWTVLCYVPFYWLCGCDLSRTTWPDCCGVTSAPLWPRIRLGCKEIEPAQILTSKLSFHKKETESDLVVWQILMFHQRNENVFTHFAKILLQKAQTSPKGFSYWATIPLSISWTLVLK